MKYLTKHFRIFANDSNIKFQEIQDLQGHGWELLEPEHYGTWSDPKIPCYTDFYLCRSV